MMISLVWTFMLILAIQYVLLNLKLIFFISKNIYFITSLIILSIVSILIFVCNFDYLAIWLPRLRFFNKNPIFWVGQFIAVCGCTVYCWRSSNILPVQVYKMQVPSPPWCVINNIIFRHWQLFSGEQNHFQLKTTDLISSFKILVFFSFYISLCVYIIFIEEFFKFIFYLFCWTFISAI